MKKARWELEEEIEKLLQHVNAKTQRKIINELLAEHGIPVSTTSDLLSFKRSPSTETLYVLYHLFKKLDEKRVGIYFEDNEINEYEGEVVKIDRVSFPLRYNVIQVDEDQWIGKISMKELIALGNAQLINYNENAQRVLTRIIKNGEEHYRIQLNKFAVEAIKESLLLQRYIPNTITLNIPKNDKSDFVYHQSTNELIIKNIGMFDILDGYHRYIAMSNAYIQDPNINQVFELRLTHFSDEKARHFIWQEDQKTKMKRVDSKALNKYDVGNQIVSRLKDSNYGNLIGRNTIIDEATLSQGISSIFLENKKYTNSEIVSIASIVKMGLVAVEDQHPEVFDAPIETDKLYCMLIAFYFKENNVDIINGFTQDMISEKIITKRRDLQVRDARKLKTLFEERRNSYV